jgi:hypothetical protein
MIRRCECSRHFDYTTENGLTPNMSGGFGVAKPPRSRPLDGLVRPRRALVRERPLMTKMTYAHRFPHALDFERQCERTAVPGQQGVHQRRVHELA